MTQATLEKLLDEGKKALEKGNTRHALTCFEQAAEMESSPEVCSYLALCLAKERGEFARAISLCRAALSDDSANSLHYLNLGKVYMLCGEKKKALQTFRNGLLRENHRTIREELKKLGWRKPPVFPSLSRDHFLNKYVGKLLHKCGLRG